jgi:hypothetical protein
VRLKWLLFQVWLILWKEDVNCGTERHDFSLSSEVILNMLVLIIMKIICILMTFDQQRYLYFRDRMHGNWYHEKWLPIYALAKEEYCFWRDNLLCKTIYSWLGVPV